MSEVITKLRSRNIKTILSAVVVQGGFATDGTVIYKGTFDASAGTLPASTQKGWMYKCAVAGVVNNYSIEVGYMVLSLVDNAGQTNLSQWDIRA